MEGLILSVKQTAGVIDLNFDALEEQLDKKLEEYKGMLFTEETKSIAKAEIADLRRFKKDLDDGRKAVKKEWMKPYDQFEKKIKALSAKVDEPINEINEQVQAFEEKRKKEKQAEIKRIFYEVADGFAGYHEYIDLNKIYDHKWENASVSVKSIKNDMADKMQAIQTAVTSIKAMRSDKEKDALALYKRSLDLNGAIQMITTYEQNKAEALRREEERRKQEEERRRLAEIERIRAEERAAIQREEQIRKEEQAKAEAVTAETVLDIADDDLPFEQPTTVTAFYRVVATPAELEAVEMAFNSIGIYFERRLANEGR